MGSYSNIPKAIFYLRKGGLLRGDYRLLRGVQVVGV